MRRRLVELFEPDARMVDDLSRPNDDWEAVAGGALPLNRLEEATAVVFDDGTRQV